MAPETQWAAGVADVRGTVAAAVRAVTDAAGPADPAGAAGLPGGGAGGGAGAHAVRLQLPQGLPPVVADGPELGRAVAELVGHAVRRSPPGVRVLVRAAVAAGADGRLDRVEIRIVDRGTSVPGGARYWSTGGLPGGPAVSALLRAAGARIGVEETPGGGLTAVLVLRLA